MSRNTKVAFAVGLMAISVTLGACSDATGPSGGCEVIFATSSPPGASGIEVTNSTGGGLSVTVGSDRYADTGSDMGAGDCNVWAFPPDRYEVRLRRCTQGGGSSECTGFLDSPVIRSIMVTEGTRSKLNVTSSFFN